MLQEEIQVSIFSKQLSEGRHYKHCEKGIEIAYVCHCSGYAVIGGKKYNNLNDTVVLFNSCEWGELYLISQEEIDVIQVLFPYYFLREIIPTIEQYSFGINPQDEEIKENILEIGKEYREKKQYYEMKIMELAYHILYKLMNQYAVRNPERLEERVWERTILEYLETNLKWIESVGEIAEHFYYSKEAFSRKFHERMGISCRQFILQKRLQRAMKLLTHTNLTLEVIRQECGFKSIRAFQENFYKVYHQLPEKFRE